MIPHSFMQSAPGPETVIDESRHLCFGVSIGSAVDMRRIHEALKSRGIMLPYVGAYTGIPPQGELRFAIFANHTAEQLDRLLAELRTLV